MVGSSVSGNCRHPSLQLYGGQSLAGRMYKVYKQVKLMYGMVWYGMVWYYILAYIAHCTCNLYLQAVESAGEYSARLLLGHRLGGSLAANLAARHPAVYRHLVQISPVITNLKTSIMCLTPCPAGAGGCCPLPALPSTLQALPPETGPLPSG